MSTYPESVEHESLETRAWISVNCLDLFPLSCLQLESSYSFCPSPVSWAALDVLLQSLTLRVCCLRPLLILPFLACC